MGETWPRDRWLDAIWEDDALKPNERAVAYVYARYAGKTEETWASYAELMRRTGMRSKRSVSTAIKALVKAGWLDEKEVARQHRSAVYRLTCPLQRLQSATAGPDRTTDRTPIAAPAVAIRPPAVAILQSSGSKTGTPVLRSIAQKRDQKASLRDASRSARREAKPDHKEIDIAATIIIADGVTVDDWPNAIKFARWIRRSRPHANHLGAYVQKLADDLALEPLWQTYLAEEF